MIKLIASDLDRTFLPNGNFKDNGSIELLKKILFKKKDIFLAFVSGRDISLIRKAIKDYKAPIPDFAISDVGTGMWKKEGRRLVRYEAWDSFISSNLSCWNIDSFKGALKGIDGLKLQGKSKQGKFKLSYYILNPQDAGVILDCVKKELFSNKQVKKEVNLVFSIDETKNLGLLDILPKIATKDKAVEFLRKNLNLKKSEILYAGDSGNDILPITSGYFAVLVRNAIPAVRKEIKEVIKKKPNLAKKIYFAKGKFGLSGYYASGILEALIYFGVVSKNEI